MLICPRCERSMETHVEGECVRRLSRRFFLGALGTAFSAAALAKVLPNVEPVAPLPGAADTLIEVVAPKVHYAATITIDSTAAWKQDPNEFVRWIARERGVPVMAKLDGDVVAYFDPNKKEG